MKSRILIDYWRSDRVIINLGDYITEILVRHMGYEPDYASNIEHGSQSHRQCLWGVGSLLDRQWVERSRCNIHVWGCGYSGDASFNSAHLAKCEIHAVRGPLTKRILKIDRRIPVGDPALLLPEFWPISRGGEPGEVIYVPHFNGKDAIDRQYLDRIGASRMVNIACQRSEFWSFVREIANARFVMTSSLHGAILSQAYGTPWALCIPSGTKLNMPFKWSDWFAYLKIEGSAVDNIDSAKEWWENEGQYGKSEDISPVFDAFPHGVAY